MSQVHARNSARLRVALLTSGACASLLIAGSAHAQAARDAAPGVPTNSYLEPQGDKTTLIPVAPEAQSDAAKVDAVAPEPQIVIANPNTPTTARDPVNVTGIGQMIVDNGGGSVGLCTGTLINPRTVIFAAHCVNSRAATAYGANSGGTAIGFGFETNTRANAPGQTDELVTWLFPGPGQFKSNVAQAFFNANFVAYNPLSLEPAAQSFLYGDVALATLDTPAAKVPTWALLFSPLTGPTTITAAGTGYSVSLVGYGNNGTGTTGSTGAIDFRRRAADNMLGALTDLQTFESFLFGGAPNGLTQNLYFLDFDDPRRGLAGASPFDFNAFRDNAVANGKEGITAPGDSGGPLLLNGLAKQIVIGVLSGGYTRFFTAQPPNGYGTVSFYQPLYLYWDWIAANNPYHYVGSVAGNGSWTDPTHWVTTLDPAYNILSGGQLVNGIPTSPGEQKNGTSGDFGQICFQSGGVSDCYDTRTGVETVDTRPIGTAASDPAEATITGGASKGAALGDLVYSIEKQDGSESTLGQSTLALPGATLANGLPGATNFVPNNADPIRASGTAGRYFDVTLAATGTTTLTGASVTIDRLTIGTAGAALVIDGTGALTSLMGVNQFAGTVAVNGTLTSGSDYTFFGGGLSGSGRINTTFLTSMAGSIAPGTATTIGKLTVGGDVVLSNGSSLFIDLGATASDVLAAVANGANPGAVNVGGNVIFSVASGDTIRFGNTYTFLTATGGVTGTFANPGAFSAILSPKLTYSANAVSVQVIAGLYANLVSPTAPVQVAYAQLLDQNRATNYAALAGVYGVLDLQNQATIRGTLDGLAPRTETLKTALGSVAVDNMARFYAERLDTIGSNGGGGTVAVIGQPLGVIAGMNTAGAAASGGLDATGAPATTTVSSGTLPDDVSVYFAGGYLTGHSAPMPTAVPLGGRDQFDGYYLAAGVEKWIGGDSAIGFGLSYTDVKGTTVGGQRAKGKLSQGTLYGKLDLGNGVAIDSQISAGLFHVDTSRTVAVATAPFTITGTDNSLAVNTEVGIRKAFTSGSFTIAPRAAFRGGYIDYSTYVENGGGPALRIDRRGLSSAQARGGLEISGGDTVRPFLSGYYVHDFADAPASFGANFAAGVGPNAQFALAGRDKDWGELSGGIAITTGTIELSVSADTTIDRRDVSNQSYRGTINFRF